MNKNQYKTLTETLIKEVDELNAVKRSSRRVIKSCDEMNKAYLDRNRFLEEKVEELEMESRLHKVSEIEKLREQLEDTQNRLKAANELSDGLTQDVIQSEKNIADLREECDRLTDSNKALRLALELKQLNGPDVSELKKEIRQLQDQNDELTRMCAPDPDIPPVNVKTAEEIKKMCGASNTCSNCGKDGNNWVDGERGCRFSLKYMLPLEWSTEEIDAIDAIIEFATAPEATE